MLFRKKARVEHPDPAEQARQELAAVEARIGAAGKMPDKGERLLVLKKIVSDIDSRLDSGQLAIRFQKMRASSKAEGYLVFTALPAAAIIGLGVVLHVVFPPAALVAVPALFGTSMVGGEILGNRAERKTEARLTEENKALFEGLARFRAEACDAADALVRHHLDDISASPKLGEVIASVPAVRDRLTEAFSREMAKKREDAAKDSAEEQPKPAAPRLQL